MTMRIADALRFAITALIRHPLRVSLTLLAITISVASIINLTGLGEGARRYVNNEFSSLGTHLLIVMPGKSETRGGTLQLFSGETPRDLTMDDARQLHKITTIKRVSPIVIGSAYVSRHQLARETPIMGASSDLLPIRRWKLAYGQFLPKSSDNRSAAICILGHKVKQELFAQVNPLGQKIRIGDRPFRVIGVLAPTGRSIGVDVENTVIIPALAAQSLFNTPSLYRILVEARSREALGTTERAIIQSIKQRHQGEEDITVITQDAVVNTFDQILGSLTLAVSGIAAISLTVAGILIMNIMLVSVSQRTAEIGLLMAIGASARVILILFLIEALLLTLAGSIIGIVLGFAMNQGIELLLPGFQVIAPFAAVILAFTIALGTGLVFAILPARRAARLNPVLALSKGR